MCLIKCILKEPDHHIWKIGALYLQGFGETDMHWYEVEKINGVRTEGVHNGTKKNVKTTYLALNIVK